MAKFRTCKICGKQYEYCGHCPSKNLIEPWRNLYCSEGCREAFEVMGKYASGKVDAAEAKAKLESFGLKPEKVRDIHKAVVVDIFRAGKQEPKFSEAVFEKEYTLIFSTEPAAPSEEIKVDNPALKTVEPVVVLPVSQSDAVEIPGFGGEDMATPEEKPNKPFKKKRKYEERRNNIVNGDLN